MTKRGQPKKFKSGQQLIQLWQEFCDYVVQTGYTIAPTQTEFSKWLSERIQGGDRRTIYNSLNKYFPEIKSDFEAIRADVITQGAMLGKYHSTMSIFALKNWCKWTDKPNEDDNAESDNEAHTELVNAIKKAIKE